MILKQLRRRGGTGYGNPSTLLPSTSYLTGPPTSTSTNDRSLHPNIAGSTGGFIGLVSGIAIVVIVCLLLGFWLYNRHRRRTPKSLDSLPSLELSEPPHDPYADDVTTRQSHFPPGIGRNPARPGYVRQKSEEWEIPDHLQSNITTKGKARSGVDVELPDHPDEAALPLRSRSPRPTSPRGWSDDSGPRNELSRATSRDSRERTENPFESEEERKYDRSKLSPQSAHYQRGGLPLPEDSEEEVGLTDPLSAGK